MKFNIFMDTQVYEKQGFNFKSNDLSRLSKLVRQTNDVRIFLGEFTEKEVYNRIHKKIEKVKSQVNKVRDIHIIDKNSAFLKKWEEDIESEELRIKSEFKNFVRKNKVEIIPLDKSSLDVILEDYLKIKPPFTQKKPKEFPDAFTLHSVLKWTNNHSEEMIVISGDEDVEKFCELHVQLRYFKTINEATNYILTNTNHGEYMRISDLIEESKDQILSALEKVELRDFFDIRNDSFEHIQVNYIKPLIVHDNLLVLEIDKESEESTSVIFTVLVKFKTGITASVFSDEASAYDFHNEKYSLKFYEKNQYNASFVLPVKMKVKINSFDDNLTQEKFELIEINESNSINFPMPVPDLKDYYKTVGEVILDRV
ncbi:hypothetical protein B9T64_06700 [Bacillus halotolerans]|uniref:PIN domain-containing protein n=2 Tax=Bacillus subtilis group TaxID=653685 RepID=UPI000BFEE58D|nr:PIN domain-containing protein [Bacillus halotolerans]PHI49667.1 hypothetical protein B9T64_06700 [Bacillus halotolerans]